MARYIGNCVSMSGRNVKYLRDMVDEAVEVTWDTFARHVPVEEVKEQFPDYCWGERRGRERALTHIKHDAYVTYHRSKWHGKTCYFITHSSIEYIWLV